jgi:serine phosphatase RsbU (regulator of sigma subunit)
VIDFKARKLCYCNAGFSCPLVSHHDGGFNLLRNTAPTTPVGAFSPEETAYSDQYLDIDNGFACVLYSDSIIETAGSSGEHFGVHRLAQSLNSMKNDKCAAILNAIQQGLNVFSDNIPPQDDRAMLMLRFNSQKNDDEK